MSDEAPDTVPTDSQLTPEVARLIDNVLTISEPRDQNDYEILTKVAIEALKFFPPFYFTSVFGNVNTWLPPHKKYSEYTILNLWKPLRTLNYLVDTTVPAFSHAPGPKARTFLPPVIQRLFWRPSDYFQQTDPFDSTRSFPKERWFFVNGIATNEDVAQMNSGLISEVFNRPVTVIHNATDSTILDLVECAIGKSFKTAPSLDVDQSMTEPAIKATVALLGALKDPNNEKVVLLCHSQGTIITANVLRALQKSLTSMQRLKDEPDARRKLSLNFIEELTLDLLYTDEAKALSKPDLNLHLANIIKKLEVYTFANCADKMNYVTFIKNSKDELVGLPYIENFANEFDLVARLGVLSPIKQTSPSIIEIDGPVYRKSGLSAWGHLLNQHYLFGVLDFLKGHGSNPYQLWDNTNHATGELPRLYDYFKGKRPAPYYS